MTWVIENKNSTSSSKVAVINLKVCCLYCISIFLVMDIFDQLAMLLFLWSTVL